MWTSLLHGAAARGSRLAGRPGLSAAGFASKGRAARRGPLPKLGALTLALQERVGGSEVGGEMALANQRSLEELQGFLRGIRSKEGKFPARKLTDLAFYVPGEEGQVVLARGRLKTSGGDCRRAVEKSLADIFSQVGLPSQFEWEDGYWDTQQDASMKGRTAAAGMPSGPQGIRVIEKSLAGPAGGGREVPEGVLPFEEALKGLDPLLEAIACVPWLDPADEEAAKRRNYITGHVLDELVERGWKVRACTHNYWQGGAGDEAATQELELLKSADTASAEVAKVILYHARKLEAEHGPPPFLGSRGVV